MASKAKQIYWAVRRVLTEKPGIMVERWETQTGDRVLPDDHFETMVYYADGPVNLYQIRQWYRPLEHLAPMHEISGALSAGRTTSFKAAG